MKLSTINRYGTPDQPETQGATLNRVYFSSGPSYPSTGTQSYSTVGKPKGESEYTIAKRFVDATLGRPPAGE